MPTSVSSHLTPEPERRLWLIWESVRTELDGVEKRAAGLAVFCAAELAALRDLAAEAPLAAGLLLAVAAFYPRMHPPKLSFDKREGERPSTDDCLVHFGDIAKYTHGEMIARFDKYLGGGITGMPYHEDIVGRIVADSRIAARKHQLLRWACLAAGLAQLVLAWSLFVG